MFNILKLPITSKFGMRTHPVRGGSAMHRGVDLAAAVGTVITSDDVLRLSRVVGLASNGKDAADGNPGGARAYYDVMSGPLIGHQVWFMHLSRVPTAKVGAIFRPGTSLGQTGNSGASTGPHLHIEVRKGGQSIDPRILWGARPTVAMRRAAAALPPAKPVVAAPAPRTIATRNVVRAVRNVLTLGTKSTSVTIKRGDTVWELLEARNPNASSSRINQLTVIARRLNPGVNLDRLKVGQVVKLPL